MIFFFFFVGGGGGGEEGGSIPNISHELLKIYSVIFVLPGPVCGKNDLFSPFLAVSLQL